MESPSILLFQSFLCYCLSFGKCTELELSSWGRSLNPGSPPKTYIFMKMEIHSQSSLIASTYTPRISKRQRYTDIHRCAKLARDTRGVTKSRGLVGDALCEPKLLLASIEVLMLTPSSTLLHPSSRAASVSGEKATLNADRFLQEGASLFRKQQATLARQGPRELSPALQTHRSASNSGPKNHTRHAPRR